jgi:CO/xanthine dehydrogenase Mo-binding subunit
MLLQTHVADLKTGMFGGVAGVGAEDGRYVSFLEISTAINTKTAGLPKDLHDVTLNCRYVYRAPFDLPDPVRKYGNLTLTYAAQVHIAVIEIDLLTYNIRVLDYAAVDDCGRVINDTVVKGQVIGAAAHGFGAALLENLKYDEGGNLLTATFSDYCPITMLNMPKIKYGNRQSPSPFTYNGAKGMGEGGGGPIFAVSSALQDAVAKMGIRLNQSHYSPSDLHDVIQRCHSHLAAAVRVQRH